MRKLQDTVIKTSSVFDYLYADAVFSRDEIYRYSLKRIWHTDKAPLVIIMLNPSTADHRVLDPTVRRCENFARAWSRGGIIILNLFALRSTDPKILKLVKFDPIGEYNYHYWETTIKLYRPPFVLCAWGTHGGYQDQDIKFVRLARKLHMPMMTLGVTKKGYPKHPLYLSKSIAPIEYKLPLERRKLL